MIPTDLYYIYSRAQKKGEASVGWITYTTGSALDIKPVLRCLRGDTGAVGKVRHYEAAAKRLLENVEREIERGLLAPFVNISYGGDPDTVPQLEGYARMAKTATARGVEVKVSHMSMTGGVNVGRKALTVGLVAQPHEFA